MAAGGSQMPKLDLNRDLPKLNKTQLDYMKIIEAQVRYIKNIYLEELL